MYAKTCIWLFLLYAWFWLESCFLTIPCVIGLWNGKRPNDSAHMSHTRTVYMKLCLFCMFIQEFIVKHLDLNLNHNHGEMCALYPSQHKPTGEHLTQSQNMLSTRSNPTLVTDFLHNQNCPINARFYQLGVNLERPNPRSEDNPRFILGLSCSVLSTFSNLGITNFVRTRLSL